MVESQDILQIVKENGPILPAQIRRHVEGSDTLMIGAILSELADDDKIQISNTKVGGSPVYYTEEQKEYLQDLKSQLNDKQQKAFDMLKEEKILRDQDQEPVIRASLREMKDFAKPLKVDTGEEKEIYWKWYLISDEKAEELIKEDLESIGSDEEEDEKEESEQKESDDQSEEDKSEEKEEQESNQPDLEEVDDDFVQKLRKFFDKNDIDILEEDIKRKGSDAKYLVNVPTPVGKQKFYCKARGKKKCNDGDLSSAWVQGQSKKLPVMFLYTGDLTNKAEEMLNGEFEGMLVKQI